MNYFKQTRVHSA